MPDQGSLKRRDRPRCRPFTTADAMTLIAALAIGFAAVRGRWEVDVEQSWNSEHPIYYTAFLLILRSGPFWLALTIACGVIRLREPHPPFRRLRDQPGAVACFAVAAVLPVLLLINVVSFAVNRERTLTQLIQVEWMQTHFPPAVLAAWALLRIGKRWRPEPGWIDVLGMVLGGGWIATFVLVLTMSVIRPG